MSDGPRSTDKSNRFAAIVTRGTVATAFFGAGISKLSCLFFIIALSDSIGALQGLSFLFGLVEIIGSFFVMVPQFAVSAALTLFVISICAVIAGALAPGYSSIPFGDLLGIGGVAIWLILTTGHNPVVFNRSWMGSSQNIPKILR
jgi:hypothetical protein